MKRKNIFSTLVLAALSVSAMAGVVHPAKMALPDDTTKVETNEVMVTVVTGSVELAPDSLKPVPVRPILTSNDSADVKANGSITGRVLDSKKEVAVNASVQLYSLPDSTLNDGKSVDEQGYFTFSAPAGDYYMLVSYIENKLPYMPITIFEGKNDTIQDLVFADRDIDAVEVTEAAQDKVKHLKVGETMTVTARDALIALYRKGFAEDRSREAYSKTLDTWKRAFCARPDRPLDLYIDGIGILNATISADTAQQNYNRIGLLNEMLMDVYELAVINIDDLNNQLDKERSDTLTVAKLRAQQLEYLRANWQMDTVLRSPIAAKGNRIYKSNERNWYSYTVTDGKKDSINWNNELFKDDEMNSKIYYMCREILKSEDLDIDMIDIDRFAQAMFYKFRKDSARVGLAEAKNIYFADTALTRSKARAVLAAIGPDETVGTGNNARSKKGYFTEVYEKGINRRFSEMDTWTIDGRDVARLVENFKKRLDSEGPEFIDQILSNPVLATNRDNIEAMTFYYDVLKRKNEVQPTYERIVNIVNRAQRLEKYSDVINYSEKMFKSPEFLDESDYTQARMYIRMVQTYEKIKGSTAQRYPYIQKAMLACPEYPEPYYYLANMIQSVNLGKQRALLKRFIFCIAYDQFEIARQKLAALEAMGDTEVKSNLTMDALQKSLAGCKRNFPIKDDVFMEGASIGMEAGKPYTLSLPFGKYTSIVRTQERSE